MKTTFSRQFVLITVLLLLTILVTGVSFWFLMRNSVETDKQHTLLGDAAAVANLARAYNSAGELEENWDFLMSLSFITEVGSGEAVVSDENGTIICCSCKYFSCNHIGQTLDKELCAAIESEKAVFLADVQQKLYPERRYVAGVPIVSEATEECIGFVIVSAPMTQVSEFMQHSTTLFFYAAIFVMMLAVIAATLLSHSQVRPLRQVAEAARRFGRGDLSARVDVPDKGTQEITDLAQAFNTMANSLEQAEQRRQEFIGNVSHELKTPMTTIGGYVDGILDGTIPQEKQQQYMQTVSAEVRRLSRLVRNMLEVSRLQAQGMDESRKVRFDVSEVLSDVLVAFEQKINAKHLQVDVEFPERTVWTRAERDSIQQVSYNLIDNAIKFSPDGGLLRLALRAEGVKALVTVENSGPTIAAEELPLLFDRFHKADKSRSADRESWGLGLYIAKTILGAHGEDIHVTSENGVTAFSFTLPLVR